MAGGQWSSRYPSQQASERDQHRELADASNIGPTELDHRPGDRAPHLRPQATARPRPPLGSGMREFKESIDRQGLATTTTRTTTTARSRPTPRSAAPRARHAARRRGRRASARRASVRASRIRHGHRTAANRARRPAEPRRAPRRSSGRGSSSASSRSSRRRRSASGRTTRSWTSSTGRSRRRRSRKGNDDPLEQTAAFQQAQKRLYLQCRPSLAARWRGRRTEPALQARWAELSDAARATAAVAPEATAGARSRSASASRSCDVQGRRPTRRCCSALPLILYQVYAFVLPAFSPRERQVALPLLAMVPFLFIGGVVFGYYRRAADARSTSSRTSTTTPSTS